ncbi:PAS domain S-box protein [Desulfoluna sp.]|uniref:sensor histidine kinase n=1 Tax=Desulfoluna sp. TaxID=2045199 RepID=UPI0026287E6B|nr:PAS domain S-box protein [Desulfoluna sp.]
MSFRTKTILGIALIEAVLLFIIILNSLTFLQRTNEEALEQYAHSTARIFAAMARDSLLASDLASLESYCQAILKSPGLKFARIISTSDGVLAATGDEQALAKPFVADRQVTDITDGTFEVTAEISESGYEFGRVEISIATDRLQGLINKARYRVLTLAGIEMILTALFSYVLGYFLTRQVGRLSIASTRIALGEFGYQIPVSGKDEIASASRTFNHMSTALKESYTDIQSALAEAKRNKHASEESEASMRAVLEGVVDAVITIDTEGLILSFNPAAEKIFGHRAEGVLGKNVAILMPEPHHSRHNRYLQRYLESGENKIIGIGREMEAIRQDGGRFPIELSVSQVNLGTKILFTGIIRDITERKKAEKELKGYREDLEQKVAKKTTELQMAQEKLVQRAIESGRAELSAMVLHNIGNAVTPLKIQVEGMQHTELEQISDLFSKAYQDLRAQVGNLDDYIQEGKRGQQVFDYLGTLGESLQRHVSSQLSMVMKMEIALNYISEIISLQQAYAAGKQEIQEMVDLNRVLEDALQVQGNLLSKQGIAVHKELSPKLPRVQIDRSRLLQVVVNLLKNASDSIMEQNASNQRITLRSGLEGPSLFMEVLDTGIGIEPARQQKIFELGNSSKGTSGFGLYYCRLFIEEHNGTIAVTSSGRGQGACIRMTLPAVATADKKLAAPPVEKRSQG